MKKVLYLFILVLVFYILLGCRGSSASSQATVVQTSPAPSWDDSVYSEEARAFEQKMCNAELVMKSFIESGRVMIEELDWSATDKKEAHIAAMGVVSDYDGALNFAGFRTDKSVPAIYLLASAPEDYYAFQQMMVQMKEGEEILEYNVFFESEFGRINSSRFCTFLQGIYGAIIDPFELQRLVDECAVHLPDVSPDCPYSIEMFHKDGVLIEVVALADTVGHRYVAIHSQFQPAFLM